MVIVASIYLRFYIKVRVRVDTFLPTLTPLKIPSDSHSTVWALQALIKMPPIYSVPQCYIHE
jgi:hypothetical protein